MPRKAFTPFVLALLVALVSSTGAQADTVLEPRTEPAVLPAPERATSGSSFTVPYFEVDRTNASGETVLFAVHNVLDVDTEVDVFYSGTDGVITGSETVQLDGNAVFTRNLRDIANLLPTADPDGVSRGLFSVTATDPLNPGVDRLVAVDVFSVTPDQNFATGQRVTPYAEMVAGPSAPFLCDLWSIRFLDGGPFSGGTRVVLFIDTPLADPNPSLQVDIYDEAGTFRGSATLTTGDLTQEVPVDVILDAAGVDLAFGSLLVDFADGTAGGHVSAVYDAEGRYSIGLDGGCLSE